MKMYSIVLDGRTGFSLQLLDSIVINKHNNTRQEISYKFQSPLGVVLSRFLCKADFDLLDSEIALLLRQNDMLGSESSTTWCTQSLTTYS